MPSTTTSPIKILSDLGYEMVDIESPEDYLSALMEALVTLQASGGSGRARADILQEELIRVRKERKAANPSGGMKVTQKRITAESIKRGSSVGGAEKIVSDQQALSGGASAGLVPIVQSIALSVNSIKEGLISQNKADKENAEDARVAAEAAEGRGREKGLETNVFKGLKKTGEKIMKPIVNLWDKLINFLSTIVLGRSLVKFIEWFSDEKNQEKISTLFRFLKDWWPALVAGLMLLLGPGILSAVGLVALLAWGVPKIIAIGKWIWDLPGKIFAFMKGGPDGDNKINTTTTPGGESRQEVRQGGVEKEQLPVDVKMGENYKQQASQLPELPTEMAQGGQVPGSGNKDTVPAMLTPGEFVMSKGAVQKWGAGTLAGMNAAGGGTNRPSVMNHYSGGGSVLKSTTNNFNLKGYRGGGYINKPMVVKGYAGGGSVMGGDIINNMQLSSLQSGPDEISPPSLAVKVAQIEEAVTRKEAAQSAPSPQTYIPDIDAGLMISPYKIKTLGVTV